MKILFLFLLNVCLLVLCTEAKNVKGTIVYKNDSIEVTFNIPFKLFDSEPNFERLQYKIKYYGSSGEKIKLNPDQAEEIYFTCDGVEYRMISVRNTIGMGNLFYMNSNVFLKIEVDGYVRLYKYFDTRSSGGGYNAATGMPMGGGSYTVEKYVLQKGNGELIKPTAINFRKDMVDYFKDCPLLKQKLEERDLRKRDLPEIVTIYNRQCR